MTNSDERGKVSCKTVAHVFSDRPWVINLWETKQNGKEDKDGYDMFVQATSDFLKAVRMGGLKKVLPVQIKSSDRRLKSFVHRYFRLGRFFNVTEKSHQFVLCGMDEDELVLADIVGQIVAHVSGFGMTETAILNSLDGWGDKEAVIAYERTKALLLFRWYGSRLPSSKK